MYIPKYYQINDYEKIKNFMIENDFVTNDGSKPVATHLPVNIEEKDGVLYISGHFAKGNKQWQTIEDNNNVLIIFSGPNAYISSSWYEKEDVPTWDYQSVHAYGIGSLLNETQLKEDLMVLLNKYESNRVNGVKWEDFSDKTKEQIKGIVGFKIKVEKLEAAYKLSQTRSQSEKENIIMNLKQSNDYQDSLLADEIENNK